MRGRQEAETAPREPREDHTTAARPNTVAHSSGAVVCPDEASARRHRDRATWWDDRAVWRSYREYEPLAPPVRYKVTRGRRWAS